MNTSRAPGLCNMAAPSQQSSLSHTPGRLTSILVACVLCFRSVVLGSVYYVSPEGSDENTGGSASEPFATVSKAVRLAGGGDTVYLRGGTYREEVYLTQGGGSAGNALKVSNYPGETPVLKGSTLVSDWEPHNGAVWKHSGWTSNSQQVFCDGQFLQQIGLPASTYSSDHYIPVGTGVQDMYPGTFHYDASSKNLYVWLPGDRDPNTAVMEVSTRGRVLWLDVPYVHVSGLTVRHSNSSSGNPGGIGVVIGPDSIIENCDIQWCDFEGLEVRSRTTALNCIVSNNGDVGIGAGRSKNYVIRRCVIEGNNYRNFRTWWHAGGLKLVSGSSGTVEECEVSNNNGNAIWFDWCRTGDPIVIRNNYVRNNRVAGILVEGCINALVYNNQVVGNRERGIFICASDHTKTLNNTIAGTSGYAALSIGGVPRLDATLTHNRLYNNVVFGSSCIFDLIMPKDNAGDTVDNTCDFNCYFRTSGSLLLATTGASYQDLDTWKTAAGFDASSINVNPQFTLASPEDYSTSPMSEVVDKGCSVPEVIDDIRGQPRPQGNTHDMGAYETSWQDCAAPSAPSNLIVTASTWNSFHLEWQAAGDNVAVAFYEIYRDGARYAYTENLEFDDVGLEELRTYQYFILAIDQAGLVSEMSNVVTVSTGSPPDVQAPTVPGSVCAVAKSKGTIALSWDPAADNVGVTKYCLFRNGVRIGFANATWFTDGNLGSKTDYDYTVTAFDAAGNESQASRVKRIRTLP
jgi:parallel beta-helix repeat protein